MVTRFGAWYLATLGPAVIVFWLALKIGPLHPTLSYTVSGIVSVGMFPILAVIATSFMLAFGIDTDRFLPRWYRRLFGLPVG